MTKFIFFLVFGLLFKTLSAMEVDEDKEKLNPNNISFLLNTRQYFTFLVKKQCPSDYEKVQQCYHGHVEVFTLLPGPTHCFGETVLITFKGHIDLLAYGSKTNTTIWSIGCKAIIRALSFLHKLGKDPDNFLRQNGIATPILFLLYREIVTSLCFGELVKPINKELKTLENLFAVILKQFYTSLAVRKRGHCGKINFEAIMKCGRRLTNMIRLIASIALSNYGCTTITIYTFEAIYVLISILYDSIMAILAICDIMAAVIYTRTQSISDDLLSYLRTLDHFINGIHKAMSSEPTDTVKDVQRLITTLNDLNVPFNQEWDQLIGPSERVAITDIQVKKVFKIR